MEYIPREQEKQIHRALERNKSVLLLGPRQTGKTTLIRRLAADLTVSLITPEIRLRYEKEPDILRKEIEVLRPKGKNRPLVVLDEVQKVPELLNVAQDLIDRLKTNFIFTGSSARKLRRGRALNLLPGRVVTLRLDPFTLSESATKDLEEKLLYGALPGIVTVESLQDRDVDLESYVTLYLEEEIRAEALVRNLASFARFIELAASESGRTSNFRKISQEISVAHTTIAAYYEILEDCMIAERVDPITKSMTRKKLTKSSKYLFFDLGVRRLAAREGTKPAREHWGHLFEQFVGLELIRAARLAAHKGRIFFWRDPDGPEVDWVIERKAEFTPIEVKWTDSPNETDVRYLKTFLAEYKNAEAGFVICRTPRKMRLTNRIYALPWQEIPALSD
ncbi:MAG: hypothetical protein A3G87_03825 [Omnitrophica bacterium RIFCSPLOWO2_12_FULL_50_11]|nr:MAG: hypothetical protein A3G87_03825 [Omnitrophica bacterium RIFCSPLOWO2_12_FULL_50_11]